MVPHWVQAVIVLLFQPWSHRRDARVQFLKLQVELLKQKLPGDRVLLKRLNAFNC